MTVPSPTGDTGWPAMNHKPYGRWGTCLEDWEDGDGPYLAEGHDRRAFAALANLIRYEGEPAGLHQVKTHAIRKIWVVFHESCGCTPEEAAEHDASGGFDCDCEHPGLPPCGDLYAWSWQRFETQDEAPIGAMPALEYHL